MSPCIRTAAAICPYSEEASLQKCKGHKSLQILEASEEEGRNTDALLAGMSVHEINSRRIKGEFEEEKNLYSLKSASNFNQSFWFKFCYAFGR